MNINPSQKLGKLDASIANAITHLSSKVFLLTADITPAGIPMSTAIATDINERKIVGSARSAKADRTDLSKNIDRPKSPVATFAMKLSPEEIKELTETGVLWFTQLTFGQGFQPIRLSTQKPQF